MSEQLFHNLCSQDSGVSESAIREASLLPPADLFYLINRDANARAKRLNLWALQRILGILAGSLGLVCFWLVASSLGIIVYYAVLTCLVLYVSYGLYQSWKKVKMITNAEAQRAHNLAEAILRLAGPHAFATVLYLVCQIHQKPETDYDKTILLSILNQLKKLAPNIDPDQAEPLSAQERAVLVDMVFMSPLYLKYIDVLRDGDATLPLSVIKLCGPSSDKNVIRFLHHVATTDALTSETKRVKLAAQEALSRLGTTSIPDEIAEMKPSS